jgi:hypothetical protein
MRMTWTVVAALDCVAPAYNSAPAGAPRNER